MVTVYLAVAAVFSLVFLLFIYKFVKNQLCVKNLRMEMITDTGQGWNHICPNMMCSIASLPFFSFQKRVETVETLCV